MMLCERYWVVVALIAVGMWASASATCDVVFCIDVSDSMTDHRTNTAKNAVREWHNVLKHENAQVDVRFGAMLYAGDAATLMALRRREQIEIDQTLDNNYANVRNEANRRAGSTNTAGCLQRSNAGNEFFQNNQNPKYMIIITDGTSNNRVTTANSIRALRQRGVRVVAIALEPEQNYDYLPGTTVHDIQELQRGSNFFYQIDPATETIVDHTNSIGIPILANICPSNLQGILRPGPPGLTGGGFPGPLGANSPLNNGVDDDGNGASSGSSSDGTTSTSSDSSSDGTTSMSSDSSSDGTTSASSDSSDSGTSATSATSATSSVSDS